MKHMYEIREAYRDALDQLTVDPETGELTGTEALEALEGDIEDKIEAYACYIKEATAFAEAMKAEKKAITAREKAASKRVEFLESRLASFMDYLGRPKFETTKCRVSFRTSTRTIILDESLIPEEYIKITQERKADATAIKAVLSNGGEVAGAALETVRNLQIK